ncbi:MAG TPA: bifunctional glutamate N-acetyltransferase/amino-acid acetyltransferase ArgJ [Sphingobacteriaceae bacterium]|nr:bifunctional glutamate N-acetyltransferase/amino-acid acetyltransferase ArgJ [Sphingobacteriaceae bacterium]
MGNRDINDFERKDKAPAGPGGVTAAAGFTAHGMHAGIRKSGKKDLAVLVAHEPVPAAAIFTVNVVRAAPVVVSAEHLQKSGGMLRAIVMNSGVANAATGQQGLEDARATARCAAEALGIPEEQVAVASTGLIGVFLPMDVIREGVPECLAAASREGHLLAAEAIMTTDTFSKEAETRRVLSDGTTITVGAMAKGAGMIHPNMATMLAFATTDARVTPAALKTALAQAGDATFNMISVDGDMSTNDAVFLMASGAAGGPLIDGPGPDFDVLVSALLEVFTKLAKDIVSDGEGATRIMEVHLQGAASPEEARLGARAVTRSTLVKAALFGGDANWGRILAALGSSGAAFDPDRVDLKIGGIPVLESGRPIPFDEQEMAAVLAENEVRFDLNLNAGDHSATAWGCDITYEYIRVNAEYRT